MTFRRLTALVLLALFLFGASAALFSQDFITIYSDNRSKAFGRSMARTGIHGINLYEFKKYSSKRTAESNGILTAVLVSSYVKSVLDTLLSDTDKIKYDNTTVTVLKRMSMGNIYRLEDSEYGIVFSFRLEKAGQGILKQIDYTYGNNSYWQQVVRKLYVRNFVVRIYSAENISGSNSSSISFSEALYMATLIGERHQPLWGIHDGLGYLDNIGYALIRKNMHDYSRYMSYRKPVANEDRLFAFISRIETMGNDFVSNLDVVARISIKTENVDRPITLPEMLITQESGTQRDLALLFYDILRRKGYQCKLALIKKMHEDSGIKMVALFEDPESYKWGIIGDLPASEEINKDWRKTFANLYHQDMKYFILDANEVIEDRVTGVPQGSGNEYWKISHF